MAPVVVDAGPPTKQSCEKKETPVAAHKAGKASLPAVDAGPPIGEIHEIEEVPVAARRRVRLQPQRR